MHSLESLRWTENLLVHHAFEISQLDGDYLEFGVFRGSSFIQAYFSAMQIVAGFLGGRWDAAGGKDDPTDMSKVWARQQWEQMRFIAFDSFSGVPKPGKIDSILPIFREGAYAAPRDEFLKELRKVGVDLDKVRIVEGFYEQSLTPEAAARLELKRIAVVHIDSDLYESAKQALAFCTPYFRDGTIVIFDDWFQFRGNPQLGEQRAFNEWRAAHPEWLVQDYLTEGSFRKAFILSQPV
ncbi:macrocin-O-methyltransferase TylF [Stella humosa]|uniref:Macrocin-O-methyltransferase TylF n=2 Tax=Stella humosa TaxID=94 RepID=A0A3N1MDK7_9PROT|nr:macrocin-O-methyltransferase TylF [Stella humosa]BBK31743.1 hypothetical protein STHU_23770 [Stella humosa]